MLQVAPTGGNQRTETNYQQMQEQQQLAATRKIGQMCLLVASVFALLWTPFQVILIAGFLSAEWFNGDMIPIAILLPCLNSCINPVIYGLMWRPFRQAFRQASELMFHFLLL